MIDWHSHILPAMDDGSRDPDESITMIDTLANQGVDTVVVTPHFYANEESVEEFLSRRQRSYDALCEKMQNRSVRILCGAEVKYYPGISRMEDLERLAIGNSKLLLLEMPFAKWSDHTVRELLALANMRGLKIVMAHIERYRALQDRRVIEKLMDEGILMQVNASYFERLGTKRKAIKNLGSGMIHLIGSDCHNLTSRPPQIQSAYDLIQKKFGSEYVTQKNEFAYGILGHQ